MKNILLNVTTEPLSCKHICYFVDENASDISLYEVVEFQYQHPDPVAPVGVTLGRIETRHIVTYNKIRDREKAYYIILLSAAQQNTKERIKACPK